METPQGSPRGFDFSSDLRRAGPRGPKGPMGPCYGRAACRSALVSTCGVTIGVWPSSSKKGDGADFPVSLPFAMNGITDAMAFRLNLSAVPAGGVPVAKRP